ncbi:MAG: methyltransferase domain-containing protein [Pseudomonadota bacterium]
MVSAHFYDAEARNYEWSRRPFLRGRGKLLSELALKEGEKALEIGCGTGWNLPFMADAVGVGGVVVGLELSRGMLAEAARGRFPPNVRLIQGDASAGIPEGGPFDAVLFSYSFSAIPDRRKALENVLASLSPAGRIGIVDFTLNRSAPAWLNRLFRAWGARHSCDFAANPLPFLDAAGFDLSRKSQSFGFSYRLIARRKSG